MVFSIPFYLCQRQNQLFGEKSHSETRSHSFRACRQEVVQWMLDTRFYRSRDTKVPKMSKMYWLVKSLVSQEMEEKETRYNLPFWKCKNIWNPSTKLWSRHTRVLSPKFQRKRYNFMPKTPLSRWVRTTNNPDSSYWILNQRIRCKQISHVSRCSDYFVFIF